MIGPRLVDAATFTGVRLASVQATMIGRGLLAGERPRRAEWAGLLISLAGLVALTLPGLTAHNGVGTLLMTSP